MILDLVLVSSIMAVPILAGALKDKSSSGTIRVLTTVISPVAGIFPLCYLFYTILQQAGVQVSFDGSSQSSYGSVVVIIFAGVSYFISLRMVRFGEEIGRQEGSGVRYDILNVTEQAWAVMEPKLQEHVCHVEERTGAVLDKKVGEHVTRLDDMATQIVTGFRELASSCRNNLQSSENLRSTNDNVQQTLAETAKELDNIRGFTGELIDLCNKLDEKNTILQARIEALDCTKEKTDQDDGISDTKLTTQDGIANRTMGIEAQHEMARYLGEIGFDIKESHGAGEADFIIRKKDEIVAIGSNKAYMLYNEPKRMQRRISLKDVEPEIILAKKLQMPLVVFVTNRRNGRRWAELVPEDELSQWSGVSTPVILAKDDESSEKLLQEEFASVLGTIGALV